MYKREPEGWLKHIDFILLDMICLQLAFGISYIIRGERINPYYYLVYRNMAIVLEMADLTAIFLLNSLHQVMQRNLYHEFSSTIKNCICVGMIALAYLFAVQEGSTYSRFTFVVTILLYFVFTLGVRFLWKHMMKAWKFYFLYSLVNFYESKKLFYRIQNDRGKVYGIQCDES